MDDEIRLGFLSSGLPGYWSSVARGPRSAGGGAVTSVRALLDAPDPRGMGLHPIVISLGTELRVSGLAAGEKPISAWELETLLADGHARATEQPLASEVIGPLCAAWVGRAFVHACLDADAPEPPFDRDSMIPLDRLGWYLVDSPAAVYAMIDAWFRQAFAAAVDRRSREIAELLSWVEPNRDETRAALYLTGTAEQRERDLAWWARLERDAGRGPADSGSLHRRIDAACARIFLEWHPPAEVPALPGPWAHVALAERCAERLAPPIDPFPREPEKSAVASAIRIARTAALRGTPAKHEEVEAVRTALLEQVHRPWEKAELGDHRYSHALYAVESALFGAEGARHQTPLGRALLSMQQGVSEIVYPDLALQPLPALWAHFSARAARAVHGDIQWLARSSSGDSVPPSFFERELWPEGPPVAWAEHVERFRRRLFASERAPERG